MQEPPEDSPGSGRSLGEGNSNPLQDSCLGNPVDRGAWRAAVGLQRVRHDLATKRRQEQTMTLGIQEADRLEQLGKHTVNNSPRREGLSCSLFSVTGAGSGGEGALIIDRVSRSLEKETETSGAPREVDVTG